MSDIEWTDLTWNPVIGCTRVRRGRDVQSGCDNCYADDVVARFEKRYDRLTTIKLGATKKGTLTFLPKNPKTGKTLGHGAQWTGAVWLLPDVLELPLRRRKPTTYFVNSLADWAHESIVESEQGRRFLAAMFGVMAATPQHTYQLLSKRPKQARKWFEWLDVEHGRTGNREIVDTLLDFARPNVDKDLWFRRVEWVAQGPSDMWPLPNVWLGKSIEDQATADERLAIELPAAVDFVSTEPLLGAVDFRGRPPSWVIVGGESGPKARPCDVAWIRSIVEQCKAAGVPCFVKQLGAKPYQLTDERLPTNAARTVVGSATDPRTEFRYMLEDSKGGDMAEWPGDLRVREMPA
jgi:protein gp37